MKTNIKNNGYIKRNGVPRFVDKQFAKELDQMKELRLKIGKDDINSISADWRLTLAMTRHPKFIIIKEDIINSDLE